MAVKQVYWFVGNPADPVVNITIGDDVFSYPSCDALVNAGVGFRWTNDETGLKNLTADIDVDTYPTITGTFTMTGTTSNYIMGYKPAEYVNGVPKPGNRCPQCFT